LTISDTYLCWDIPVSYYREPRENRWVYGKQLFFNNVTGAHYEVLLAKKQLFFLMIWLDLGTLIQLSMYEKVCITEPTVVGEAGTNRYGSRS
jgi:hypothetical protein